MAGEAPRELATTRALDELPSGQWRELYEVRASRRLANLDHIVVGRAGVFVIDSRDWSAQVELDSHALTQDGFTREATLARLVDAATCLAEMLPGLDRRHVVPVLCFDHDEPVSAWVGEVLVCTTANVVDLLVTQRRVLEVERVDSVFTQLTWALLSEDYRVGEPSGPVRTGHRREGRARTPLTPRRRAQVRQASAKLRRRMTPWVRAALIDVACCVVMFSAIRFGTWPGTLV